MRCGFRRGSSHGRHLAAIFDHRQCVWGTWRRVSLTGVVGSGSSLKKELQGQCSTPFSLWLYFCPSPWLPWTAAVVLLELRTAPGPKIYFSLLPSSVALERPLLAHPEPCLVLCSRSGFSLRGSYTTWPSWILGTCFSSWFPLFAFLSFLMLTQIPISNV